MAHGLEKLMVQISLQDLSIAELVELEAAFKRGDEKAAEGILYQLSWNDLQNLMAGCNQLNDQEACEIIQELVEEKLVTSQWDGECDWSEISREEE